MEENESKSTASPDASEHPAEDAPEEAETHENAELKKTGTKRSFLFFKIFFTLFFMALAGLGGFWSYGRIKKGMKSSAVLHRLETKISRLKAGQNQVLETLHDLKSGIDGLKASNRGLTGIPGRLSALDAKTAEISRTLARVSGSLAKAANRPSPPVRGEESVDSSGPGEGSIEPEAIREGKRPEKKTRIKKGEPFEKLVKSLLTDTGRGLKWMFGKLAVAAGFAYREILKNFS